jgi:hypothetical protein
MKQVLAVFIALFLAGCASAKYYEESLNTWVGADEQKLVKSWGAPDSTYLTDDHKKIITYLKAGPANTERDSRAKLSSAAQEYCKTEFYMDELGHVARWRWEGRCASRKPAAR